MRTRVVTVGIIKNEQGKILLCRMADNHGVYPGKWGLVGGGMEEGENVDQSMKREIFEEVGLKVKSLKRIFFNDDTRTKIFRDGTSEDQYLIYLMFEVVTEGDVKLNDEWSEYKWVNLDEIEDFDINDKTRESFVMYKKYFCK